MMCKEQLSIVKDVVKDMLKALAAGIAVSAVISVVLFLGGFLFGSFKLVNGLEVMKDGLLLLTAIGLFLAAGMLLVKGKREGVDEKKEAKNGWRHHFKRIGLKTVVIIISVAFVIFASIADYVMLML